MRTKRLTREEARARILAKASGLFRRFGCSKTTVADIARELEMSPANVYKFFPSKNAIIQAVSAQSLIEKKDTLLRVTRSRQSAVKRIKKVALSIYGFHRECSRHERQLYKLVIVATEENWACVREFKGFLAGILNDLVEDGVRTREFRRADAQATTQVLLDSLTWITHPLLFHELKPDEVEARISAQIRFFEKALR